MQPHFLQSKPWQTFQSSQGRKIFTAATPQYSYLALLTPTPLGPYLYLPYGPTLATKTALPQALKSLKSLAADQKAIFIRIEPTTNTTPTALKSHDFHKIPAINPEHTWLLDLSPPESTILAQMKQNNRNLYKNYQKKGLTIHETTDPAKITHLTSLLSQIATHNKIKIHSAQYLKSQLETGIAKLFFVTLKGTPHPIAAALIYDSPTTRYYAHAAADYAHRSLSAGTILLAHLIIDAKQKGLKSFDFYGITPSEDPTHPWYGFTKFKKSFGGHPLTYLGTWDLPLHPLKYRLYTLLRTLNRALHH
jgi:lipid II:glycine glycyltransferase (peptidoglycan interpeptide bridge formation enzyme)